MPAAEVKIFQKDGDPDIYVDARITSDRKLATGGVLKAGKEMQFAKGTPQSEMRKVIGIVGGAAAEYLGLHYKDNINADIAVKAIREVFDEQYTKFTEGQRNQTTDTLSLY